MPINTLISAVMRWTERTFATRGELKQVEAIESSIEAVESQIESMKPDWDAEEGEPGYIKNKPFRLDGVTQRVTLPETSVTTSKYAIYPYPRGNIYPPEQFIIGATYHVTFEGETYTCVCRKYESGPVHIGNGKYDSKSDGNGEPFLLWANGVQGTFYLCTEKTGTYTVAASVDEPKYKTLSEVYLPADALVGHLGEDGEIFNDYENNVASGGHSHAEGVRTTASGYGSHAEGEWSTASGSYSHAEGTDTIADHNGAHAEGCGSSATGPFSHAEGYHTTAASDEQHVQGRYNVVDSERVYAHIVGNGKNNSLAANIHTIDWIGNGWFSGNLYVGGTSKEEAFPVGFVTHTETYTFDGDTSGRDTFVLNNADFYKVADAPDMKSIVDWTVTKVNVTQEDISNNTISITMDEGRARCFGEYVFVVSVSGTVKLTTFDYGYTYSVNVPSPGVYVMWDKSYGQVTELKLTLGTPMVEVVSALESRIDVLGDLIPAGISSGMTVLYENAYPGSGATIFPIETPLIQAGKTYVIEWDGVIYEQVATDNLNLGCETTSGVSDPANLPFRITQMGNQLGVTGRTTNGATTFKLMQYALQVNGEPVALVSDIPQSGSDWNAAEGDPGYISNKPFEIDTVRTEMISGTKPQNTGSQKLGQEYSFLHEVDTIEIVFDDVTYILDKKKVLKYTIFGNGSIIHQAYDTGSNEPVAIYVSEPYGSWSIKTVDKEIHNFTIYADQPVVTTIDDRFIPQTIARINTIHAADWNATDGEDGHIENKPFGPMATRTEIINSKYAVPVDNYTRIGLDTKLLGDASSLEIIFDGIRYEVPKRMNSYGYAYYGNWSIYDGTGEDTGEPFLIYLSAGVEWDLRVTTAGYYTLVVNKVERSTKSIDEEFIPDTIARTDAIVALETRIAALEAALAAQTN